MKKNLVEKIDYLGTLTDTEALIRGEKNSKRAVRAYFRLNHVFYRRFHSKEGFMHFRVTKEGKMKDSDVYYQLDFISQYIRSGARVMELGFGQGANLVYLAKKHPDVFFTGADLLLPKKTELPPNVTLIQGNYSSLPELPDASFDLIFGIETIVYNTDKEKVFREAYRLLAPGGVFIIYDYALFKPFCEHADETEKKAIELISKCGASAMIESKGEWQDALVRSGFELDELNDISKYTLPDLERLAKKAARVLEDKPHAAKAMFRLTPRHFTNNVIIGYLGYDSCRDGVIGYFEWVVEKPLTSDA